MGANYDIINRTGMLLIAVLCCISVAAQSTKTDSIGESEDSMQIAEIRASFPGGQGELMSWLAKNMHYPEELKRFKDGCLCHFMWRKMVRLVMSMWSDLASRKMALQAQS